MNAIDYDFVICKATEGVNFVDATCDGFVQKALAAGKCVGVYHFARSGSAIEQARHFVNSIQGYIGKAALFLDWENAGTYDNEVLSQGVSWAKLWLDEVYKLTGVKPMIYMSKSVCREYDWSSVAQADYGLWMAQYPNYDLTGYQSEPWTDNGGVGAFSGWAIHQYASTGRLGGYDYDKVQARVNEVLNQDSLEEVAKRVIRGEFGNGQDRVNRLTAAGYDYAKVQACVNELM